MPVLRLPGADSLDHMGDGYSNDALDTFLPQNFGVQEPLVTYARPGDVQFVQLVHHSDNPELAGWPLMTTMKVSMHKCDKCSREFISLINYRRHIKVHRRSLNIDKESHKIRVDLAAFWNKLTLDDATEIASFTDTDTLKETSGSSIVKALTSALNQPMIWSVPQHYMLAGKILLDVISGKDTRYPMSSEELLNVLDDASENTFLCAGMAESLQKHVFDVEASKIALDIKNAIATAVFLFEQKLVKAMLAEKDAEALRCQKLLVEEEEAAQKRLAKQLERKKQKKLRQREQRARVQSNGENVAPALEEVTSSIPFLEIPSYPQPAWKAPVLPNAGSSSPQPAWKPLVLSSAESSSSQSTLKPPVLSNASGSSQPAWKAAVLSNAGSSSSQPAWKAAVLSNVGSSRSQPTSEAPGLSIDGSSRSRPTSDAPGLSNDGSSRSRPTSDAPGLSNDGSSHSRPTSDAPGLSSDGSSRSQPTSEAPGLSIDGSSHSQPTSEAPGLSNDESSRSQPTPEAPGLSNDESSRSQPTSEAPGMSNDGSSVTEPLQFSNIEEKDDASALDIDSDYLTCIQSYIQQVKAKIEQPDHDQWQMSKSPKVGRNNIQDLNVKAAQKHIPAKDSGAVVSSNKVWTKKLKEENVELSSKPELEEEVNQADVRKMSELLIGSMTVPLENTTPWKSGIRSGEQPGNSDNLQLSVNQASHKDRKISPPIQRADPGTEDVQLGKSDDLTAPDGSSCVQLSKSDDQSIQSKDEVTKILSSLEFSTDSAKAFLSQQSNRVLKSETSSGEQPGNPDNLQHSVKQVAHKQWMPVNRQGKKKPLSILRVDPAIKDVQTAPDGSNDRSPDEVAKALSGLQFSTESARAFLAQRWNEAMAAEHVTLETPAESAAAPGSDQTTPNDSTEEPPTSKKSKGRSRKTPEKGTKVQYIPKQRIGA